MADPIPYNLTIPSQAASLVYSPLRGSSNNTNDAWVLSYSGGLVAQDSYWGRRGIGADYHTTTQKGASIQVSWVGTGIYFYGNASSDSYNLKVNGQNVQGADVPNGGLLGSKDGLPYKQHSATLSVSGGKRVAFQYAQVTIGYGYPGNDVQNRTIQAVSDDGKTPNRQFFNFAGGDSGGWAPETPQPGITFPNGTETKISYQMKTSLKTDALRFQVKNASGFVLWGSMFSDHFPKRAKLTPDPATNTSSKSTDIYDICSMLDFQQVLYWESGLDHDTTYTVEITNIDPDRNSFLAFNKLELLDGGPAPPKPSSSDGFQSRYIPAIVVPIVAVAALIAGLLFWRRRRRRHRKNLLKYEGVLETPTDASEHSIEPFPPPTTTNRPREIDAGPLSTLPPEYDTSWAGGDESQGDHATERSSEPSGTTNSDTTGSGKPGLAPIRTKR
ncbi:hypothetical protein V5O48_001966 [Marasmius crinis-equi]|uniref:Uncharacterized protein n=1 Tax=Marasmius crinis-equi TaxID=585013 RepID=A0ABR3FXH0_9AGAR